MTRLTSSHVSVMLYYSVPTANTWSWYQNVIKPIMKHKREVL